MHKLFIILSLFTFQLLAYDHDKEHQPLPVKQLKCDAVIKLQYNSMINNDNYGICNDLNGPILINQPSYEKHKMLLPGDAVDSDWLYTHLQGCPQIAGIKLLFGKAQAKNYLRILTPDGKTYFIKLIYDGCFIGQKTPRTVLLSTILKKGKPYTPKDMEYVEPLIGNHRHYQTHEQVAQHIEYLKQEELKFSSSP